MRTLLFFSFLAMLLWLPLPEASKPVWGMMVLASLSYVLAAGTSLAYVSGRLPLTSSFKKARPLHVGFLLIICWLWFQQIPLPVEWVQTLSPKTAELYQLTSLNSHSATLSIDPRSTLHSALLTTAYYALFCLALLLVNSQKRLEQLLLTMVLRALFRQFLVP